MMYGIGGSVTAATPGIMPDYNPPCPVGYAALPGFQQGVSESMKTLPSSLMVGPMVLIGGGVPFGDNVLGPDGITACKRTGSNKSISYTFGLALPGLAVIGVAAYLLFGRRQ